MHVEKKSKELTRLSQLKANLKLHFLRKIRRPFGTAVEIIVPMSFLILCFLVPAPTGLRSFRAVNETSPVPLFNTSGLRTRVSKKRLFVGGQAGPAFMRELVTWLKQPPVANAVAHWRRLRLVRGSSRSVDMLGEVKVERFDDETLSAAIRVPQYEGFVRMPPLETEAVPASKCRERPTGRLVLPPHGDCPPSAYFYSGYAGIQGLVECAYLFKVINGTTGKCARTSLVFAGMGKYKEQRKDRSLDRHDDLIFSIFPVLLTFFLSLILPFFLRAIIEEKEEDMKGLMIIMGLKKLGWLITYAVEVFIIAIIGTVPIVTLVYAGISYGVFFVLIFCYCLSLLTLGAMISTLQTKSTSAVIWGLTASCAMAIITQLVFAEWQIWSWVFTIFSSASFACALKLLADYYQKENEHGSFGDVFVLQDDHKITVYVYTIVMLAQTLIYFLIAVWFDGIIPSEFGIHRDPWYCFKPQRKKPTDEEKKLQFDEEKHESRENLPEAKKRQVTISMYQVTKNFHKQCKEKVAALEDITVHFCKGEIIALVGGNACGKTTLFRVLTGVVRPNKGEARLMGCDTSNPLQMSTVRPFLGVCRQVDVAFKHLTIYEHLEFFARLKGIAVKKLDKRITRYTKALDLDNHLDMPFSHLPQGIRRKLCFLIAFIGDPKILLLDDPSTGLDPISRRRMWSLLKRHQSERTVILSSNILNDADALADRTIVLEDGKIKCAGTTDFILGKYSRGYHLRFTLRLAADEVIRFLEKIVTSAVPESEIGKSHGNELSFVLPLNKKKSFDILFDKLDKEVKGNRDVIDYGISTPTLEHIFYGFHRSLYKVKTDQHEKLQTGDLSRHSIRKSSYDVRVKDHHHFFQEFQALSRLRYIKKANDICSFTPLIILPMLLLAFTIIYLAAHRTSKRRTFYPNASNVDVIDGYSPVLRMDTTSSPHVIPGSLVAYLSSLLNQSGLTPNLYINITESPTTDGDVLSGQEATLASALIGISFALIPAGLMIEYISDREIGARKLLWLVGSSPMVYFSSFVSFYGVLMLITTVYYIILLGSAQLPVISSASALLVQFCILVWNTIPTFLFVCTLSHLFPRALTLTSYFFVIFTGVIPFGIADRFVHTPNSFRVCHILFAFLSPIYIPFGTMLVFFHQLDHGKNIASLEIYILFIAGLFHCLWLAPLWLADQCVNGKPITFFRSSPDTGSAGDRYNEPTRAGKPAGGVKKDTKAKSEKVEEARNEVRNEAPANVPKQSEGTKNKKITRDKTQLKATQPSIGSKNKGTKRTKEGHAKEPKHLTEAKEEKEPKGKAPPPPPQAHFATEATNTSYSTTNQTGDEDKKTNQIMVDNLRDMTVGSGTPENYLTAGKMEAESALGSEFVPDPSAILEAKYLYKNYPGMMCGHEERTVIKNFNINVRPGEIVCIVGRNGSGKTTLTKLIIGTEEPTKGSIMYKHKPIWESDLFDNVGYSPEGGLWKYVTVEQHLMLYAALKGIDECELTRHVKQFMTAMDFDYDSNRCVIRCGGGTRKKVHVAIALMGHPDIIVLDEPTTGLDTFSKRLVWDFLLEYCGGVKTVFMCTPWLEEAEALGTQIGFLENGNLSSCGTYEDLKAAGEKRYTLKIRLDIPEKVTDQKKQLAEVISIAPGTKFQERFLTRFIFDIPNPKGHVTIKKIFHFLEERRKSLGIIQYTISNNTLGKYIF